MAVGFFEEQVRRTNWNLLVAGAQVGGLVLVVWLLFFPYLRNCWEGPVRMTVEEVMELKAVPWRDYVRVRVPQDWVDEEGYKITGGKERRRSYFYFVRLGERYLVVHNQGEQMGNEVVGSVEALSSEVRNKVLPAMGRHLKGKPAKWMVNTEDYRWGLLPLGGYSAVGVGIVVWILWLVWSRGRDARRHPLFKELAKYGPAEEVREAVDGDVAANGKRVRDVVIGRDWLMRLNKLGVTVMNVGDAAWMYLRRRGKVMGMWSSEADWVLVVRDVRSIAREYFVTEAEGKMLLEELGRRVPWAETGYSEELQREWVNDRARFLERVGTRRELAEK